MRWNQSDDRERIGDRRLGPGRLGRFGRCCVLALAAVAAVRGAATSGQIAGTSYASFEPASTSWTTAHSADPLMEFVAAILGLTEDVWKAQFETLKRDYKEPRLVVFSGKVQTGCGPGRSESGPFYCPADGALYLDLDFFRELKDRYRAPGDFARAYVIAHEVGHHVQQLLGTLDKVRKQQGGLSAEEADALQVRLELQADFLAGVWAHHADKMRHILEPGDLDAGRAAIVALGDNRPAPTAATGCWNGKHGTAAQRLRWFNRGFETGDLARGDTFEGDL
jgi:predicted metalloprotease